MHVQLLNVPTVVSGTVLVHDARHGLTCFQDFVDHRVRTSCLTFSIARLLSS